MLRTYTYNRIAKYAEVILVYLLMWDVGTAWML